MKKLAYTVLGLAAATSVARAEPSVTESAPPPPPAPSSYYIQAGALAGVDTVAVFDGLSLEGGYHLQRTPLWVHGMVADGEMRGLFAVTEASAYVQMRGGVETRGCLADDLICGIAGVDLGYAHEMLMSDSHDGSFDGLQVIPRAALDFGTKHVRVRPGVEAMIDRNGFDGLGFTGALAFVW